MTTQLHLLVWTTVLAIVQIMLAASARTQETGVAYNLGARDQAGPPVGVTTARLQRAQANLFETLPLFAIAILVAHVAGRDGTLTYLGAWLYFLGRIAYVPLYAMGIPMYRTGAWGVALFGLILVLLAILF